MNVDIRCFSERGFGYHEDHEGTPRQPLDADCPMRSRVRPTVGPPSGWAVLAGPRVCCAGLDSRSELLRPVPLAHRVGLGLLS